MTTASVMPNQRKFRTPEGFVWHMQPDGKLTNKPRASDSAVAYASLAEFGEYHQFSEITEPQEVPIICARCLWPDTPADIRLNDEPLCFDCTRQLIEAGLGPHAVIAAPLNFRQKKAA